MKPDAPRTNTASRAKAISASGRIEYGCRAKTKRAPATMAAPKLAQLWMGFLLENWRASGKNNRATTPKSGVTANCSSSLRCNASIRRSQHCQIGGNVIDLRRGLETVEGLSGLNRTTKRWWDIFVACKPPDSLSYGCGEKGWSRSSPRAPTANGCLICLVYERTILPLAKSV